MLQVSLGMGPYEALSPQGRSMIHNLFCIMPKEGASSAASGASALPGTNQCVLVLLFHLSLE